LKERQEAKAMDETELIPTEPITVILSTNGWVRAAKGHDIDPESLNYRTGDSFRAAACGHSNQNAIFLDSTGRCYTLPVYQLPSARSFGEPVASRLNPPEGASFVGVMLGMPEDVYLLGSNAGYGFLASLEDLYTRNKNGKAVIFIPHAGTALIPTRVTDTKKDFAAAVSSIGRLLVIQTSELPILAKGKGLKIINIPAAKFKSQEEYVVAMTAIPSGFNLIITAGQRKLILKPKDLENYTGERGRRGNMLPRGYRNVSRMKIIAE
jgi:topoisomerase IV subunit A